MKIITLVLLITLTASTTYSMEDSRQNPNHTKPLDIPIDFIKSVPFDLNWSEKSEDNAQFMFDSQDKSTKLPEYLSANEPCSEGKTCSTDYVQTSEKQAADTDSPTNFADFEEEVYPENSEITPTSNATEDSYTHGCKHNGRKTGKKGR